MFPIPDSIDVWQMVNPHQLDQRFIFGVTILMWLVVWNMTFMTFPILGRIIPTDELIFFRGVGIPPTSHSIVFSSLPRCSRKSKYLSTCSVPRKWPVPYKRNKWVFEAEHLMLLTQERMWTNPNEIPDNGIDDDGNLDHKDHDIGGLETKI